MFETREIEEAKAILKIAIGIGSARGERLIVQHEKTRHAGERRARPERLDHRARYHGAAAIDREAEVDKRFGPLAVEIHQMERLGSPVEGPGAANRERLAKEDALQDREEAGLHGLSELTKIALQMIDIAMDLIELERRVH